MNFAGGWAVGRPGKQPGRQAAKQGTRHTLPGSLAGYLVWLLYLVRLVFLAGWPATWFNCCQVWLHCLSGWSAA